MKEKEHKIFDVEEGSIASRLGIKPGDILLRINGQGMEDVFDYYFLTSDEHLSVSVRKPGGETKEYEVEKEYSEDLGISFENGLMDEYRSCRNKCIFCFIDQMPPDMRETLYFKDDDSRLSFLQGNYVTLTNMSDDDISRIIRYRLEPINISVHTTNPDLRCRMLNNRFAGDALKKMRTLADAGIQMNAQIVLCKGINDGDELERSLSDLTSYIPAMQSVSVVPVGLTKYREKLYPLEPFEKEDAREVLEIINRWQQYCFEQYQTHFVHAGDEWYLLAEENFPEEERYDGYPQLENGVGMVRLLETEFTECLKEDSRRQDEQKLSTRGFFRKRRKVRRGKEPEGEYAESIGLREEPHSLSVATGELAAPLLGKLACSFTALHPQTRIRVIPVENRFFGEKITVSGLLTGRDLIRQLSGQDLGERLLIPCNMLRSGERVFLDDVSVDELEQALQVPVHVVKSDGAALYNAFCFL